MTTLRDKTTTISDKTETPFFGIESIEKNTLHIRAFLNERVRPFGDDVEIKDVEIYNTYGNGRRRIMQGNFKTTFNEYAFFLSVNYADYDLVFEKDYGYKYQFNVARQQMTQRFFSEMLGRIDAGFEWEEFIDAVNEKCEDEDFENEHNQYMRDVREEDRLNEAYNY